MSEGLIDAAGQTALPREVAALSSVSGHAGDSVYETAIAAGDTQTMVVYRVVTDRDPYAGYIGYALAELVGDDTWEWVEEGIIDPSGRDALRFPSVAYNPLTGEFLVCAMHALGSTNGEIVLARWDGSSFGSWEALHTDPGSGFLPLSVMPRIVGGQFLAASFAEAGDIHEFYIVWMHSSYLAYLHTRDGTTWYSSCVEDEWRFALTDVNDCDYRIGNEKWAIPRVYGGRPLYVALMTTNGANGKNTIEFFRGDDVNSGGHAGEVKFTQLVADSQGTPLRLDMNIERYALAAALPGGLDTLGWENYPFGGDDGEYSPSRVQGGFDLAVDPTSASTLWLVYTDTDGESTTDINVYLRKLTRVSGAIWSLGAPREVHTDALWPYETDQFMPSIQVDGEGNIHVVYYDDRNYNILSDQEDGNATTNPRFDVFYAFSDDGGDTWLNIELCDSPGASCSGTEEAMDYNDLGSPTNFGLEHYVGIDVRGDRVFTAFMGTSATRDPNGSAEKSLIWSSQVVLP